MRKFIPLSIFAVAFALVEAAVVAYLRQLFYPEGFSFPIKPIPDNVLHLELWREAATLAMLGSIGAAAGRTGWQKFSFFMYVFGLWDIFYYVWLKVFVNWPESFFTPDVLFLLPVIWWGPVLAPVIVAFSLCASALIIVCFEGRGYRFRATSLDAVWVIVGALIILYTFTADAPLLEAGLDPPGYRWPVFFLGELVGIAAFGRMLSRREKI
ncbi:MAG: hypothetical protein IEMM0002_0608 [bacterium]|nr:MAG: hypothetical protein IEMM0002_0608 [bacterium]